MPNKYQFPLSPSSVGTQTCFFNWGPGEVRGFYIVLWGPFPSYEVSQSHLRKTHYRLSIQNSIGLAQGDVVLNVFPNVDSSGYAFGVAEAYFDRPVVLTETHLLQLTFWGDDIMLHVARSNDVIEGFTVSIGTSLVVGDHA